MSQNPKMTSATKPRAGYTFIELIVVVLIIGTFIGIASPKFRNTFENYQLDAFVKDIYYLSRYLGQVSISEGKVYYLKINRQNSVLEFQAYFRNTEGELAPLSDRFSKPSKAPSGVALSFSEPSDISGIYFYPDGSLDPATLKFQNKQKNEIALVYKGISGVIKIQ